MSDTIILGAGLAGLSAAYHLKGEYEIYEKELRVGGLCRTENLGGFQFDYAVHILYSSDAYAAHLIRGLLGDNFTAQAKSAWVYSKGVLTPFPFQANTYGLPVEVVKECILGLIRARYEGNSHGPPRDFEGWVLRTFGEGIARHFMLPFNRKLWAIPLRQMTHEWIADRVLQPELEEVLEGALREQSKIFGPNAQFWYPREGGMEALPRAFLPHIRGLHLESEVVEISPREKRIRLRNGEIRPYRRLIFSLPLPALLDLIEDLPPQVRRATAVLEHNTILAVNLGVEREAISDKHWIYYPEERFVFHRISLPMNFSPSMAPAGKSSITVEIATSRHKPVEREGLVDRVIENLVEAGILKDKGEVSVTQVLELTPAYVIYTHPHRESVSLVHGFLRENDIYPCGRFGDWEYLNMDHAILSGKRAAEEVNARS